jgi:rubrerythrin
MRTVGVFRGMLVRRFMDVQRRYASSIAGEVPPDQTLPELWVMHAEQHARAKALLDELSNPKSRRWGCPGCGKLIEGPFEQCWNCGASMPGGAR